MFVYNRFLHGFSMYVDKSRVCLSSLKILLLGCFLNTKKEYLILIAICFLTRSYRINGEENKSTVLTTPLMESKKI